MGRYITTNLTYATTTVTTAISYAANVNDRVLCTAGGITITLPSTTIDGTALTEGDTVQVVDVSGTAGSSNITIGRNGAKIQGLAEDMLIDISNASPTYVYTGATYGWVLAGS